MRRLLERDELATTDVVLMEVLAGARDADHRDRLRALLARCGFAATEAPRDYEDAAEIFRACRAAGETVRGLTDCLIATVAIRAGSRSCTLTPTSRRSPATPALALA